MDLGGGRVGPFHPLVYQLYLLFFGAMMFKVFLASLYMDMCHPLEGGPCLTHVCFESQAKNPRKHGCGAGTRQFLKM